MEGKDIISSGLIEQYVLGLTNPEDTRLIEELAKSDPEIKSEIEEIQLSLEHYAASFAVQPSSSVKNKVMSRIGSREEQTTPVVPVKNAGAKVIGMNSFYKWAAAACFVLLLGSIYLNYSYYNQYHSAANELAATNQTLNEEQKKNSEMNSDMGVVKDKQAMPVVLKGTPHAPQALAKIFWMQNSGEVYVDPSNLPAAPSGKQYQLWAIVDGKPVDGGMISTSNNDIFRIQKMKTFGKAQAFAITLEKAGGSPAPTMDEMYVIAKI